MNIKWDSEDYTDNFSFVHIYGEDLLNWVDVKEGSFVVDLGSGNGALTEKLSMKGYRVLGIDASKEMLEAAKALHPELTFVYGDAVTFSLEEKADCIFSNAVFHWIDKAKQLSMLKNLSSNLKEGGSLVAELGGYRCAESVHSALSEAFSYFGLVYPRTFYFPKVGEYTSLMEEAGLLTTYAHLFDRPTKQEGEDGLEKWIKMFVKAPFESLEDELKGKIIKRAVETAKGELYRDSHWFVDYVRLRVKAVKTSF